MFIKLTQLNGKAIWFNQAYIVTVEPRKGPGALVVPLGDGLDYEVLESPESILEALGGALVPIAASKKPVTSEKPADPVKDQALPQPAEEPDFRIDGGLIVPVASKTNPETESKETGSRKKKSATAAKPATNAKAVTKKTAAKETSKKATKESAKTAATKVKKKTALPPMPLTKDQLMRLQKMSPGSLRKLVNTLMSQFAVAETSPVVDALCAREIISVTDQGHVNWNWRQADPFLSVT